MSSLFERRIDTLSKFSGDIFNGRQLGIEKESLRITEEGRISKASHPHALGAALTNRYITTDYSEALLEFVTPPLKHGSASIQFLSEIHSAVYSALDDELLWPFSMPCRLNDESDIPIAHYGYSNIGRVKSIYREGLGHRYGKYMQAISGIHFNYSLPGSFWKLWQQLSLGDKKNKSGEDIISHAYFGLVRNIRRLDWLLLYLFGASPSVCGSFLKGNPIGLEKMRDNTFFGKNATSLRMSDIGYQNSNQASLYVSANSLEEYVNDLSKAVASPNDDYRSLGIKKGKEYLQLNANQLQIEDEYYSTIRPKRVASSGETPTSALRRGGVEYVELRALDISPFDPIGFNANQQKFLEAFLLYALLMESPPISDTERDEIRENQLLVAMSGRKPGLKLRRNGSTEKLDDWAKEIFEQLVPICILLDDENELENGFSEALSSQLAVVKDSDLTPSSKLISDLDESGLEFSEYGLKVALEYRDYFNNLSDDFNNHKLVFTQEAEDSLRRQLEIEQKDSISLDDYIKRYYS